MIQDKALWARSEAEQACHEDVDFARNLRVVETFYRHARALGALSAPATAPLDLKAELRSPRVIRGGGRR